MPFTVIFFMQLRYDLSLHKSYTIVQVMCGMRGNNTIFAVYKPKGISSNALLEQMRHATGIKKIGHAGTLDPLASGVLVVGIGREATKKLGEFVKKEKEYIAKIRLGRESTTDDEEGVKTEHVVSLPPKKDVIEQIIKKCIGEIMQKPPAYSAVKIKGKEAYKLARKGIGVSLPPRKVEIKEIEILDYEWPYLSIRVVTGSGVYIRSLARDIGNELGTGGYLAELERTRVGDFTKENAILPNIPLF